MYQVVPAGRDARYPLRPYWATTGDVVSELCATLLHSLRRRDQRRTAEQYLRGLLSVDGRKSIRKIATMAGGNAAEQRLHHFISGSTWDWQPIRTALAGFLGHAIRPRAMVLQSLQIPKAGRHSVGVDRQFVPELGQSVNGQQAYGLWLASETRAAPVSWRLFLPEPWVTDDTMRGRAEIPAGHGVQSMSDCAIETVLESADGGRAERLPVILDARTIGPHAAADRLGAAGLPFVARVAGTTQILVADPVLPGYRRGAMPAQQLLELVKGLRRPTEWRDPVTGVGQTTLVARIRVTVPPERPEPGAAADRSDRMFTLFGEWQDPWRAPTHLWLTDMTSSSLGALMRLTKLARRVTWDFVQVGDRVGLRDFVGRSFHGWHRHMTLASVAHTAALLGSASTAEWQGDMAASPWGPTNGAMRASGLSA